MPDMTDLSIIVFHTGIGTPKKADMQSMAGKLGLLVQFKEGVGYEICQYRNGVTIEKKGAITSMEQTFFSTPDEVYDVLEAHLKTLGYAMGNIFLAVEGNLGDPGAVSTTDNCWNFLATFNPLNAAVFSSTPECLGHAAGVLDEPKFSHMHVKTVTTADLPGYMKAQYRKISTEAETNRSTLEGVSLFCLNCSFFEAPCFPVRRRGGAAEEAPPDSISNSVVKRTSGYDSPVFH